MSKLKKINKTQIKNRLKNIFKVFSSSSFPISLYTNTLRLPSTVNILRVSRARRRRRNEEIEILQKSKKKENE
jgi:hypothetical protein